MGATSSLVGLVKMPGIFWSFSKLGYQKRSAKFEDTEISLKGKTVAITGANSGIGRAAAERMISLGARVWLLCRNPERGAAALQDIRELAKYGGSAELAIVDMADLASIRHVVDAIDTEHLDALIHNAGSLQDERVVTQDGFEFDFALHLAGPHLLTKLLQPKLGICRGRVIFVSSGGMYSERFSLAATDWSDRSYDGVKAYAQVKRGQIILTSLWAQHDSSIDVHAMHPGWVDTPGVETSLPRFYRRMRRWLRTPAQGADTIVWLAGANHLPAGSGQFWLDREQAAIHILPHTREARDEPERLWLALEAATEAGNP